MAIVVAVALAALAARSPHAVFLVAEPEYESARTLPAFARAELEPRRIRTSFVFSDPDVPDGFSGLLGAGPADVLIVSVRRRGPRDAELEAIRQHVANGKPVIGIRTASHAFAPRTALPPGHAAWPAFDWEVLGGRYDNHYSNKGGTDIHAAATRHPILAGLARWRFHSPGTLYKFPALAPGTAVVLRGTANWDGRMVEQPVAWTYETGGRRSFYTSLGHPGDFEDPGFRRLLVNAVFWSLGRQAPGATQRPQASGAPAQNKAGAPSTAAR